MVKNIGVQAALSIGHAFHQQEQQHQIELFHRRADTLMQLFETSKDLRVDQTLISAMDAIAKGIQKATPFNIVSVSLHDAKTGLLTRVVGAGIDEATLADLQTQQQPWASISQLMKPEFEIGDLYFIPADQAPVIPGDVQLLTTMTEAQQKPNAWDPEDILMIPIYDNNDNPLGLISVDAPRDGLRPDRIVFETLEVFAAQAALTITSGLSISEFQTQIDSLRDDVERQKSLVGFSQRSLPMLLHKDLEQTIAISHLNQRARHIRASLQLTEAISRQFDSSTALLTLGQQMLTSFDMSVAIFGPGDARRPTNYQYFGEFAARC